MIPRTGELAVLISKWNVNQQRKNKWKQDRYEAIDYYNGNTKDYTNKFFSTSTLNKIVTGNINITKRVIDRVSLVYMTPPIRTYTVEEIPELFVNKDGTRDIDKSNKNLTHLTDALGYAVDWEYPTVKPFIGTTDR